MSQTLRVMDALVHQLRDLATSLRAAEEALPDEIRGTDGTGAVAASLGRAGDVTGIDVDADWSTHLDPTALGAAQTAQVIAMKGAASAADAFSNGAWPVGTV